MLKKSLIFSFTSLLSLNIAQAEPISELVVTAKGGQTLADVLPTSHVLTQADIQAAQVKDIPALLDTVSGISSRDSGGRGSVTGVFVRGTSNSQVIVLIDGVRVGSASLGEAALNTYPIEAIERVEVVKGPLSGIYGADAVGGVIHLFTKKGGAGLGTATATIGSNSLTEFGVSFNGGNDKHGFTIAAHSEDTDGIDRTSITTGGNDDIDGFDEVAFSFAGKTTLSDTTVAQLSVLYSDSETEFDALFGNDIGNVTETETFSSALNITSQLNDNLVWTATLGINEDESTTFSTFPGSVTTERDNIATELAYGFNSNSSITVGIDYYQEEIEGTTNFPETERDNTGIYGLFQSRLDKFAIVASLRYDDNSAYGDETNGSVALNYDFSDTVRGVISAGTSFSAPSFNFLFFPFFGNPDLLPEESENYEISLIGNTSNLDWRISVYQTEITNLFSFDPSTFLAANIGEAELQGVELELSTVLGGWSLDASLDLLSADNETTSVELDDRAETTLKLSASRNFGKLDLRFDVKAEEGRFDLSGTELSSYVLFDVSAQYQINEQFSLLANIDNIFDKDYTVNLVSATQRFNTEGIQAKLTLKYDF